MGFAVSWRYSLALMSLLIVLCARSHLPLDL
jgi:hypothetical protein